MKKHMVIFKMAEGERAREGLRCLPLKPLLELSLMPSDNRSPPIRRALNYLLRGQPMKVVLNQPTNYMYVHLPLGPPLFLNLCIVFRVLAFVQPRAFPVGQVLMNEHQILEQTQILCTDPFRELEESLF
jgi:hypothetical protein